MPDRIIWQILARAVGGLVILSGLAWPGRAPAQAAEDFYRGKTLRLVVGSDVSGEYDATARLLARHLPDHVPGHPSIIVQNMPGASGIKSANFLAAIAPRDGTVLATFNKSTPLAEVTRMSNANYKSAELNWLGSLTHSNSLVVVAARTGVKTLHDATLREVTIGSIGAGGTMSLYPLILNRALGARFRLVQGYAGGQLVDLAMERGEVDGRGTYTWADMKATRPDWIRNKTVNILVQFGREREPDLADVPLPVELGRDDEERAALAFLSSDIPIGKSFVMPPQVPRERVALMRQAFTETMTDARLLADANTSGIEIKPIAGVELQAMIREIVATPPAIVDVAKRWTTDN
jgi:tripartite-type tricarboxylate transporter receptor subunit TctC